jgi:hypothetical protein
MLKIRALAAIALVAAAPVSAEVKSISDRGFAVYHEVTTPSAPGAAFNAMVRDVSKWWESAHTWSGSAGNLYFDAQLGGCFCERLPDGGGVEHLRIIYLAPAKEIRMRGALGPLQQMGLQGAMTWKLETVANGTRITFEYIVNGHLPGGFEGLAPVVDGVIGAQLGSLANYLGSN